MRSKMLVLLLGSLGCILVGCARPGGDQSSAEKMVKIDGSSTVFPISEAVAEEFQKQDRSVKVTVGISGTGGGFKKFCNGEIDISDASRPIKPTEVDACGKNGIEYIELPVAYDGLSIVINPKNTWVDHLTTEELKKMWEPEAQGKITRWKQIRASWPDQELHLYGAGIDSGTFDYFTEAIVHKERASRGDYTSSEDDNVVVQGVARDDLALGYFGFAYYEENQDSLKIVPIDDGKDDNGKGAITPSNDSIRDGTYQPLSRPIFIYVNKKAAERPEIAAFIKFYLGNAVELVKEVQYVPLPQKAYELAQARFDGGVTGSLFGGKGSQVGVRIEDLLAKQ